MIKIVTDSSAHLPADEIARYDITVIPLKVLFGHRTYREGIDLTNDEFYTMLRQARELPTTSQPSAGEFADVYRKLAAENHAIISIHLPSKLSGTVASAEAARAMVPDADITVVDTDWISIPLGLIVREAARAAQAGYRKEDILKLINEMSRRLHILFVVDTLEYLQRGGRIGGAQALMGTLLRIKPILHLVHGRIEPLDKVRTKKAAIQRLLDLMAERVTNNGPIHVGILHAQAPEEAKVLEAMIRQRFNCAEVFRIEVGPVIGTHTGPGTVGVGFLNGHGFRTIQPVEGAKEQRQMATSLG